jgi:hypothetical protein
VRPRRKIRGMEVLIDVVLALPIIGVAALPGGF